jgi:hypothetical protein
MIAALLALVLVLVIMFLLSRQRHTVKPKNLFSSTAASKDPPVNGTTPGQAPSAEHILQQRFLDSSSSGGFTAERATRMPGNPRITRPIRGAPSIQNHVPSQPGLITYSRLQQEPGPLASLTPPRLAHAQSRHELELEYERGMRTIYDEKVGAINFIGMHVVMDTPAEVEIAFHVCKRQIRTVLRSRGLERAPTLSDIGGIVIGRDATAAWGQAFKNYLEEMCIKVGKDTYLLAHYNSQADRPDRNQLQEKIRRIQFTTCAALNNFQSNIFDTREEAVAFLQRMREVYRV